MGYEPCAIDIFSGCGGVSCGLTLSGFTVKAAVEIDDSAARTYLGYPPLSHVNVLRGAEHGDICKLTGDDILKVAGINKGDIYLLAGCPPCQNFSRQNPANAYKPVAERKKLLFEFLRVIEELEPPFILMENVPGIKSDCNRDILEEFLFRLRTGYAVEYAILNSADYGVPQARRRFVLHAVRTDIYKELIAAGSGLKLPPATHSRDGANGLLPWKTVREAIGDLPAIKAGETYEDPTGRIHNHKCANLSDINIRRIRAIRENGGSRDGLPEDLVLKCHKKTDRYGKIFRGHRDAYGIMAADKPSPTITGGCLDYSEGRFGHYEQDRGISIREAARLQTFPDDFIFGGSLSASARQIGNAVPIDLVRANAEILKQEMGAVAAGRAFHHGAPDGSETHILAKGD